MDAIDKEIVAKQYLDDSERCACGLGYEYARRGLSQGSSPFELSDWRHPMFNFGWRSYFAAKAHRKTLST